MIEDNIERYKHLEYFCLNYKSAKQVFGFDKEMEKHPDSASVGEDLFDYGTCSDTEHRRGPSLWLAKRAPSEFVSMA